MTEEGTSMVQARAGLPGFTGMVELGSSFAPRPEIGHVLFDFDGTLSLIRQGWPEVMVPLFAEMLPHLPGESEDDIRQLVLDDIMRLNGKQTISVLCPARRPGRSETSPPLEKETIEWQPAPPGAC